MPIYIYKYVYIKYVNIYTYVYIHAAPCFLTTGTWQIQTLVTSLAEVEHKLAANSATNIDTNSAALSSMDEESAGDVSQKSC